MEQFRPGDEHRTRRHANKPASPRRAPDAGTPAEESCGEWEEVTLDDLTEAAELLDCLEARGVRGAELVVLGERSFVVRWRTDRPEVG